MSTESKLRVGRVNALCLKPPDALAENQAPKELEAILEFQADERQETDGVTARQLFGLLFSFVARAIYLPEQLAVRLFELFLPLVLHSVSTALHRFLMP